MAGRQDVGGLRFWNCDASDGEGQRHVSIRHLWAGKPEMVRLEIKTGLISTRSSV
jgi:hypothetical protein